MSARFPRLLWDDPWEGILFPSRLCDQHFGCMVPDDFLPTASRLLPRAMARPAGGQVQQSGFSEVVNSDNEFRVSMDVQHFQPVEINIKTKDNRIIVSARHEERADQHGFISREFIRQYILPRDVDPDTVVSSLNRDGVLTLKAPKMALDTTERIIPITQE